jgi:hypothetical protein
MRRGWRGPGRGAGEDRAGGVLPPPGATLNQGMVPGLSQLAPASPLLQSRLALPVLPTFRVCVSVSPCSIVSAKELGVTLAIGTSPRTVEVTGLVTSGASGSLVSRVTNYPTTYLAAFPVMAHLSPVVGLGPHRALGRRWAGRPARAIARGRRNTCRMRA